MEASMAEFVGANQQAAPAAVDLPLLTTAEIDADTHGVLRRYRVAYPVVRHEIGSYMVLRYADIERLINDPRTVSTETAFPEMYGFTEGALFDFFKEGMLFASGDVHRRRRVPFARGFATRMIANMRPVIRKSAEELIDGWYADGEVEFVEQFASQLPARIIGDLLGLPRSDIPSFTKLVYDLTLFLGTNVVPEQIPISDAACRELRDYVQATLDDRRRSPRDDFLSRILANVDDAGELSPLEIVFQVLQLIVGGTDTTRVALTMQLALLLQHREQWDAVCRDSGLVAAAVAESLRFEPSVGGFARMTTADIHVGDTVVPAGNLITFLNISGMRDENTYARPDVFDIHRTGQPRLHPIFGSGAHRCIGEALARAELEEALAVLAARIPHIRLDRAPTISGYSGIRRIDTMRVSWVP
jgi:cytochrome P450 family 103